MPFCAQCLSEDRLELDLEGTTFRVLCWSCLYEHLRSGRWTFSDAAPSRVAVGAHPVDGNRRIGVPGGKK